MARGNYCRIDGSTSGEDRDAQMESFNAKGSDQFLFMLSTRGRPRHQPRHRRHRHHLRFGLEPADGLAGDGPRAPHRPDEACRVYRLITEGTVEEKIIERSQKKLFLDAAVIQQGRLAETSKQLSKVRRRRPLDSRAPAPSASPSASPLPSISQPLTPVPPTQVPPTPVPPTPVPPLASLTGIPPTALRARPSQEEILGMVRFGADAVFNAATDAGDPTEEDIEALLARGEERTRVDNERLQATANSLANFALGGEEKSLYEYEGKDWSEKARGKDAWSLSLPKRVTKQNYDENEYYRNALHKEGKGARARRALAGRRLPVL